MIENKDDVETTPVVANGTAMKPTPASERFFIRLGVGVVIAVFGGVALWSVLAPIEGAVIAGGQVVVESNRKAVQHLEGGVIGAIEVREGDDVQEGDVVARLDDTIQSASVALIDGQLTEQYARRARLEAERDGEDEIAAPEGVEDVIAQKTLVRKLEGQRDLFAARRTTRITQVELLNERIVQQEERIVGFNVQIGSLADQLHLIADELEGIRALYEDGFAPKTRLRELEREEKRLEGERGALAAGVAEATSIIAEARLEIERLQEFTREEAIADLRDVEVSISELEERRIAAVDALRRTEIRAPQSGKVLGLSVHTVGGVIGAGAPIMEIVPANDRLRIAARLAPQDVDTVRIGQTTVVRFSAFGSRRTPEASGSVAGISADSMIDETTGAPYYLVLVDLPSSEEMRSILKDKLLVPGMPVEAFIRTGAKPAINYLLKPLTDSFARSMREE